MMTGEDGARTALPVACLTTRSPNGYSTRHRESGRAPAAHAAMIAAKAATTPPSHPAAPGLDHRLVITPEPGK